jgi:hypothetical protein
MSVHRLAKYRTDDPFTRVPNTAIADPNLDLKARGLLLLMLSKPDGWIFRERNLADSAGVGRDQLRAAMQTLISAGYVVRTFESVDGKPPICITKVFDRPLGTEVGLSEVGKPDRGETRPLSNEVLEVTNDSSIAATPKEKAAKERRTVRGRRNRLQHRLDERHQIGTRPTQRRDQRAARHRRDTPTGRRPRRRLPEAVSGHAAHPVSTRQALGQPG